VIDNSAATKPALNDESFTRLLEAAYIMQKHQDSSQQQVATAGFPQILTDIVELQRFIQTKDLDLVYALELIASKLCDSTGAAGVAIASIEGNQLNFVTGKGSAQLLAGSSIPIDASSSYQCVRSGKCVRSFDTAADLRLNLELARKLGAKSFLAAPVFRDGKAAGTIELLFANVRGFGEIEIRATELMATLVAEVMTQQAEHELKKELATERATVLLALEKLKPQLQKLAGTDVVTPTTEETKVEPELCRACGHSFVGDETSCLTCGASRATGKYPGAELQSKWAALWDKQLVDPDQGPSFRKPVLDEKPAPEMQEVEFDLEAELAEFDKDPDTSVHAENGGVEETALVPAPAFPRVADTLETASDAESDEATPAEEQSLASNLRIQSWTERLRKTVATRTGDISLILAIVVCAVVLAWGLRSHPSPKASGNHPATSVRRRSRPQPPQLSFFEKAMVNLGLAVPPPAPEYMGDPNIKVWVDLQTGLYYCPGNVLYGVTPKGRYATQNAAQQDQFESAARKPCD
jgi:hypothetical protein